MSKPVKQLIRNEISKRLAGITDMAVVSVVGVDGNTSNRLRGELLKKGIRVMVVKNAMARQAFETMGLSAVGDLLEGPCAIAYGGESVVDVVREVLGRVKEIPELQVKGAYMEGEVFGPERVEELSKYPTRIEALGKLSAAAIGPGAKLAGALIGPGGVIAGILKVIEERSDEEPEAEAAPAAEEAAPAAEAEAAPEAKAEAAPEAKAEAAPAAEAEAAPEAEAEAAPEAKAEAAPEADADAPPEA